MNVLNRGIQLYLLLLTTIATVVVVWGSNRFILENTTVGTGWAALIGSAVALVTIGLGIRSLHPSVGSDSPADDYPW